MANLINRDQLSYDSLDILTFKPLIYYNNLVLLKNGSIISRESFNYLKEFLLLQ